MKYLRKKTTLIQLFKTGRLQHSINVDVDFHPPFFTIFVKGQPFNECL